MVAGQALDRPRLSDQLLGLWTALEILSNSPRGQTEDVCKRIPNLWVDGQTSSIAEVLHATKGLRNRWVHAGDFDPHFEAPVSELRHDAAMVINRYAHLTSGFRTSADFDYLFAHMTTSTEILNRNSRLGKLIAEMRTKKA